jgi:hypothetical protein
MPPPEDPSPAPSASCPRCGAATAHPFAGAGGVCLRCAGERAFALGGNLPLEPSAEPAASAALPDADSPARIGPYEIIEELGRGGMGRVYAARQSGLGRIVALKVLSLGPGAPPELEMRFLREAQTVARLRHPHIVSIYDSGRAAGHVYFSMDYLEDGDLARRLRERPPAPREAAALVAKVADALAHAHAEGILHRDLKPSNILLDGAEPRLADFGLATQLETSGDFTSASGVFGTPHYLAPEAMVGGGAALTAASDLYALGVVLYALLTGRTPYAGASPAELPALLRDTDPPSPRLLAPAVPRDLETICLKCLERDPARRYAGAAALAGDLRRFLAGEAILAAPPGRLDRFRRFARRHRTALLAAAAVFLALAVATAVSTSLAIRATRAEKLAATEAAAARAVSEFLQRDLLAQASTFSRSDRQVTLRAVLDEAAKKIEGRFTAQPLVEAALHETLGLTFNSLGEYPIARRHLVRALALREKISGPHDPAALRTACQLAATDFNLADYARAEPLARTTVQRQLALLGPNHPDTLQTQTALAAIYDWQGRLDESEALFRDTLARQQRRLDPAHVDCLETMGGLSSTLLDAGKFAEAEQLLRTMHAIAEPSLGPGSPYTLLALNNLAGALWSQGKFAEAGEIHRQNLRQTRDVLGPEHPDTLRFATSLARAYAAEGRPAEAAALHRETLDIRRRTLGDDYHDTLRSLAYLAAAERDLGHAAAAEDLFAKALESERRVLGPEHPDTQQCANDYAGVLLSREKFAAAAALLAESVTVRATQSPADWRRAFARVQLGAALAGLKRYAEAEPHLVEGRTALIAQQDRIPPLNRSVLADTQRYLDQFLAARAAAAPPAQ